jgi:hypothetical protein
VFFHQKKRGNSREFLNKKKSSCDAGIQYPFKENKGREQGNGGTAETAFKKLFSF